MKCEVIDSNYSYSVLKVLTSMILDSSMVEHSAVNRVVVGSSPTRGAGSKESKQYGAVAKW